MIKVYGEGTIQVAYNEVAQGYQMAYDTEAKQKGVVLAQDHETFFPTVPLNGWRARDLAEYIFGEREAGLIELGLTKVVPAYVIRELPGFDGDNQAIVDEFEPTSMVTIEVVVNDPSYGSHIKVSQASIQVGIKE